MPTGRRQFLSKTAFLLAGVTVGAVSLSGCESTSVQTVIPPEEAPVAGLRNAEFGWSIPGLNNASAYAYFRVMVDLLVSVADFDASYAPAAVGGNLGSAQVLCRAWVTRGQVPTFNGLAPGATTAFPASADFGSIRVSNPDNLTVSCDAAPLQDVFYSVILRSWVPANGAYSQAARAVSAQPSLALYAGDYLVFGMDHVGVPGSVDVQAVLGYVSAG